MANPTLRSETSCVPGNTNWTVINAPAGAVAGDLGHLFIWFGADPGVITPSTGWSLVVSATNIGAVNKGWGYIYQRTMTATGADSNNWTWANNIAGNGKAFYTCSQNAKVSALDFSAIGATGGTGTPQVVPTQTVNNNGALVLMAVMSNDQVTPTSASAISNGATLQDSYVINIPPFVQGGIGYKASVAAGASGAFNFTFTGSVNQDGAIYYILGIDPNPSSGGGLLLRGVS